jgi:hypothetical protein
MRNKMMEMRNKTILSGLEQGTFITNQGGQLGSSQGPGAWSNHGTTVTYRGALPVDTVGHIHSHPGAPSSSGVDNNSYKRMFELSSSISYFYIVGRSGQINKIDPTTGANQVIAADGSWMNGNPCGGKI